MKTILVVISKDIVRRNILETEFWPELTARSAGVRIVLCVEQGKGELYREKFQASNLVIEEFRHPAHRPFARAIFFLVRNGIRSKSTTTHRWRLYARGDFSLPITLIRSFLSFFLARFCWYKRLLRWLILKAPQPFVVQHLFDTYSPNLVFITSPVDFAFNDMVSIEARRRKARIISMVRSWDNLSHHGLLAVIPDRFVFQNKWLQESAAMFQCIPSELRRTDPIGIPHYDSYKNPRSLIEGRDAFFKRMNLDPAKKLIFAGGAEYYYSEDALPKLLDGMIESGTIQKPTQVIFRPHPNSMFKNEDYEFSKLKHVTPNVASVFEDPRSFTDSRTFVNLLYHSDVTINIASTLSIDAAAFDRPTIAIDFDDPTKKLSYWESVHRFNDHFDHQERLNATSGVRLPDSPEALARDINDYLRDPSLDAAGRRKIIDEFAAPFDGNSGKRLAEVLSDEIARL
jgi:hypothetical protein